MQTEIDFGVPSARNPDKRFYPHFDGENWVCDCEHYRIHKTQCRHILIKQLEQEPVRYKNGVRDTSIDAYIELLDDPDTLNERYQEILVALWKIGKPSTDREIARYLVRGDPNYVRPRRCWPKGQENTSLTRLLKMLKKENVMYQVRLLMYGISLKKGD
jgi:hypothetical protein